MEIDVIAKHMPGLLEFKKRVEEMIAAADNGSGSPAERLDSQIADLRNVLSGISHDVAALQVLRSGDAARLSEVSGLLDGLAGLKDMAEWLAANRDGLELLLSIGDDMAAPKAAPADASQSDSATAPISDASAPVAPDTAERPAAAADQPVT